MIALRIELRRGAASSLFAALLVSGIYASFKAVPRYSWSWPQAVYALGQAGLLCGPIAAGIAAWGGSRCHRRGLQTWEDGAAGGRMQGPLAELSALLLAGALAFVGTTGVVFIRAVESAENSGPYILRTVATGSALLLLIVLGYVAGRCVPYRLTPLVAAFGVNFAVQHVYSSALDLRWDLFLPDNLQLFDEFNRADRLVPLFQLLWYTGIALMAISALAVTRTRSPRSAMLLA